MAKKKQNNNNKKGKKEEEAPASPVPAVDEVYVSHCS